MKAFNLKIISLILLIPGLSVAGYSVTADEILQRIDSHRSVSNSFEMTIRVDSYKNGQFEDTTLMKGYVKEGKVTQISYLEPANMRGRKILVKDNDMWIVVPNTKNPIRITASQRLMGGVSYGDVARVSYAEDYSAKLAGEESVIGMDSNGNKSEAKKCYILELLAKDNGANYNKINMWVDEELYLPVKADFFALSGKKMSTAFYTTPKEWDGRKIISKIFLYDQVVTSKYSSMEYLDMRIIPDTNSSANGVFTASSQSNKTGSAPATRK